MLITHNTIASLCESILHVVIVREQAALVKFFSEQGLDFIPRCCRKFFHPGDQKIKSILSNCIIFPYFSFLIVIGFGVCSKEWRELNSTYTNQEGSIHLKDDPSFFAAVF